MMRDRPNLPEVGSRIEKLLEELGSSADQSTIERAEELVRLLMELYGAGFERVVEIVGSDEEAGSRLLTRLTGDELVESLLVLHDLHPQTVDDRIHEALEKVRPYLGSHAGGVEYLGLDLESVVHLRLQGSCDGCPSSTVTVKLAIERAILEAAPEVAGVHVEGVTETSKPAHGLVQIEPLGSPVSAHNGGAPADNWVSLDDVGGLPPGQTRAIEVQGARVLVCSANGNLYAYRNRCPSCHSSLDGGSLRGERLTCGGCSETYDVRLAGRSTNGSGLHLDPLPLLVAETGVRVAIPPVLDR